MFEPVDRVTILCKSDYKILSKLGYKRYSKEDQSDGEFAKLRAVKILDDHLCPRNLVKIGTIIGLKDLDTGTMATLVLTDGADRSTGTTRFTAVSVQSSLGMAFLGMRKGENIK